MIAQDVVQAGRAIDYYQQQDNTFTGTRECKFLMAIMEALDQNDQEALCV